MTPKIPQCSLSPSLRKNSSGVRWVVVTGRLKPIMAPLAFQRNQSRRWAGVLLIAAGGLAVCLAIPPPRDRRAPPRLKERRLFEAAPLRVGAATLPLPVGVGTALAGYGPLRGAARGVRDPPMARAVAIGPLGLVALDLVEVPAALVDEIRRRSPGTSPLWVVATHTHSGPGGIDPSPLAQALGVGRFKRDRFDSIAACATEAVSQARSRAEPSTLWLAAEPHPEAQELRRPGGQPDPTLVALRALGPDGKVVATLVVFGDHPTLLPSRERLLSADWPGAAARALERSGGIAIVLQGAGGDTTPPRRNSDVDPTERMTHFGERVAGLAEAALRSARSLPDASFESCAVEVALPPLDLAPLVPLGLHAPLDRLLGRWAPRTADVELIRLDGITLSCVPGEVTGAARRALWPRGEGPPDSILISLCGGDVSYIEAPDVWSRGEGERELSFFGPRLAQALGEGLRACDPPGK
jgi:neutral ceramidase